jgi:hypothetical protein
MQRVNLLIAFVLSSSLLTSCATSPPDIPICVEITPSRGYCINTISSTEFEVNDHNLMNGVSWWHARPSMLMLPASSWAKLKVYIITQCKQTGACDKEVSNWERTVNAVDKTLENK